MILNEFQQTQTKDLIMQTHRSNYNKFRALVSEGKFDQIDMIQLNKEKQAVIEHLNNCSVEGIMQDFSQLSFFQQRYLILSKFLANRKSKTDLDLDQDNRITHLFRNSYNQYAQNDQQSNETKKFKRIQSLQFNQKLQRQSPNFSAQKTGIGAPIIQFFEKKQMQAKPVGFKDIIQKRNNVSTSSRAFSRKHRPPAHDLQVKKLLQENKRLHLQLEKKSRQDVELNQYQKNVLREQKQRCMKRIEQLEEQVQQLARNNFKFQQIQKQRTRRVIVQTFVNQDTMQNQSKNQLMPYYIPTRHNDLKVITQKNKIKKAEISQKQFVNLLTNIPPIQKKEQYSFDDSINMNQLGSKPLDNLILQGLLQQIDDKPKMQNYAQYKDSRSPKKPIFKDSNRQAPDYFRQQAQQNQRRLKANKYRSNVSIDNGSRFDSFSIAQTAYNNSSLFLNASKNEVNIDSTTSTRNKVAFFKDSLVIYKDQSIQIAFKRSNLDPTYSRVRLIFYINNKQDRILPVDIQYDYETSYYFIRLTEKLRSINPCSQGRQVVEIQLSQYCADLNSVIDAHFILGQKKLDLWVPLCFILWSNDKVTENGQMGFMVVQPDRQFCNHKNMSKILPITKQIRSTTDQVLAYLYGRSKFGTHQIKLTWWQKQLTIDANVKILDYLAFVMHHFK